MIKNKHSISLSMIVLFIVSLGFVTLLFLGPWVFEAYLIGYRGFSPEGEALSMLKNVFGICFYSSSVFATLMLISLFKLLINIKKSQIFIKENVWYVRIVSWCCFIIALICFCGGFFYMPLMFVFFAGGFTGVMLRVLKNVMQSAVELKADSDLTI